MHATALSFPGARLRFAPDATPARLHIELPESLGGSSGVGLYSRAKSAKAGRRSPTRIAQRDLLPLPWPLYADPTLEAARKVHNCRYFSEPHLATVCAALGDERERRGRFGWFCNDAERLQAQLVRPGAPA